MSIENLNKITETIIGRAIEVHKVLGPGLLESAYESCLVYELQQFGLKVERQKPVSILYKGMDIDCGYRLDLLIEDSVVVELKAVDSLLPIHKAQILSYLKLSGLSLGLLINFNVESLRYGIQRVVNNFSETSALSATSAVKTGGHFEE